MKNIFKKNQIIITALAIMIAVAGYLNFTQDKISETASNGSTSDTVTLKASPDAQSESDKIADESDVIDSASLDISSEDMLDMSVADNGDILVTGEESVEDVLNADKEDSKQTADNEDTSQTADNEDASQTADNGDVSQTADSGEIDKTGEAVLVDNTLGNNFFASAKLNREQTRAKNKETLMSIVNSKELTESQKKNAINNILDMTAIAEKENATETMLSAKGYQNCVVSIVDGTVDVVVAGNELTEQQITQIEDIVKRKTEVEAKNIVITPVNSASSSAE